MHMDSASQPLLDSRASVSGAWGTAWAWSKLGVDNRHSNAEQPKESCCQREVAQPTPDVENTATPPAKSLAAAPSREHTSFTLPAPTCPEFLLQERNQVPGARDTSSCVQDAKEGLHRLFDNAGELSGKLLKLTYRSWCLIICALNIYWFYHQYAVIWGWPVLFYGFLGLADLFLAIIIVTLFATAAIGLGMYLILAEWAPSSRCLSHRQVDIARASAAALMLIGGTMGITLLFFPYLKIEGIGYALIESAILTAIADVMCCNKLVIGRLD